jgi:hypothetical protein
MVWNGGYMVVDANNTRMVSFKTQFETQFETAIAEFEMNAATRGGGILFSVFSSYPS